MSYGSPMKCPIYTHTELRHYNCGLWDGKGGVMTTWRVKEMLTRVAVMTTFFLLTEEDVSIVSEYPDVLH